MREFLVKLPCSLFSPQFYANLLWRETGTGLSYVAAASLIDVIGSVIVMWKVFALIGALMSSVADQTPELRFNNHHLSIDSAEPVKISLDMPGLERKAGRSPFIIIDTSFPAGDLQSIKAYMEQNEIAVLVTSDQAIVQSKTELKVYDFGKMNDQVITKQDIYHISDRIRSWSPPVLLALGLLVRFIANFLKSVIGGVVAVIIGSFTRTVPDFSAGMRLASAAIIPQALIAALLPSHSAWSLLVWLGYIVFGAVSARRFKSEKPGTNHNTWT